MAGVRWAVKMGDESLESGRGELAGREGARKFTGSTDGRRAFWFGGLSFSRRKQVGAMSGPAATLMRTCLSCLQVKVGILRKLGDIGWQRWVEGQLLEELGISRHVFVSYIEDWGYVGGGFGENQTIWHVNLPGRRFSSAWDVCNGIEPLESSTMSGARFSTSEPEACFSHARREETKRGEDEQDQGY